MRCPDCETGIDVLTGACERGHVRRDETGLLRLVEGPMAERLAALERAIAADRERRGRRPIPRAAVGLLPDGPATAGDHEWRLRRLDLRLVRERLRGRGRLRVLDVGAWNGWLSARLAGDGHDVTGVEYTAGPTGLGARAVEGPRWLAIQLDLEDLARLEDRYDLVILNRGLQFSPDPAAMVHQAAERLIDGGEVIATGLAVFRRPARVAARVAADAEAFRRRYGREPFVRPTRAYLDGTDLARLEAAGLRTRPMPGLRLANLRARIDPARPEYRYGLLGRSDR